MKQENQGMPHSEETERLVLGTVINTRDALVEIPQITEEYFYHTFHRMIFREIKAIDRLGLRYDAMAVLNALRGKISDDDRIKYFKLVSNQCFDLPQHVAALNDLLARRRIYEIAHYMLATVHTSSEDPYDVMNEVKKRFEGIYEEESEGVTTLNDAMSEVMDIVNKNISNPEPCNGTPTGFKSLDARGVLRPTNLTVIAADSSQGKTSLAVSMCMNAASTGTKIAFYTMEMTPPELAARMLSKETGINGRAIVSSPLNRDELVTIDRSVQKICNMPVYFDGRSSSSIDDILSSIRMMKKRFNIDGVIIDYLQILSVNGGKNDEAGQEAKMGSVARRLKNIAKDLGIWVLALSQLSRDKIDCAPMIGRIRGSGQIAEAADVVMLLYRPEYYGRDKRYPDPYANVSTENTAMIDIAKGRNVGTWKMICGFNAPTTQFYDLIDVPHIKAGKEDDPPF